MPKVTVKMQWNEHQRQYLMLHALDERFIYHYHDCGTVRTLFPGLDKEKPQKYEIDIVHLGGENG